MTGLKSNLIPLADPNAPSLHKRRLDRQKFGALRLDTYKKEDGQAILTGNRKASTSVLGGEQSRFYHSRG